MFTPLYVHIANSTPSRPKSVWHVNWNVVLLAEIALLGLIVWSVL